MNNQKKIDDVGDFIAKHKNWDGVAQSLALQLDSYWPKIVSNVGEVDVIDFFSGCGGMSAGFKAVNAIVPAYRLALAVDVDRDANNTYASNIGISPQNIDIGELERKPKLASKLIREARASSGAPLVMIGCAPCQGFSSHRNAAGEKDSRNSLFAAFVKIACSAKPDVLIIENVPEILTDKYWPIVSKSREMLARAGYHSSLVVHNMADFGVPQQRFRALLVAMRNPFRMPQAFLSKEQHRTVRDAIGRLPVLKPGVVCPIDEQHVTAGHRPSTIETIKAVPLNGGSRPSHVGPECLRRAEGRNGRAVYEDVYGRLWWDKPAITITAYARNPASGRYVHPEQNRGLSVRESALLQGFPSSYTFSGNFDSRFRQIGNAVPPTFSAYLAMHVLRELFHPAARGSSGAGIQAPIGPSFSRLIPALKAGHRKIREGAFSEEHTVAT